MDSEASFYMSSESSENLERGEEPGLNDFDLIKLRKLTENRLVLSKNQDVMMHERTQKRVASS